MIIAIDGPAGSGKSTVAQRLALRLGFDYLDTGAMYRALTLRALRINAPLNDEAELSEMASGLELKTEYAARRRPPYRVIMDGEDVTSEIRSREVSTHVSLVSSLPGVRREMVSKQRRIAAGTNVVVEGRDVGTVVFPRADLKFFVTASPEERARRRYREMKRDGLNISMQTIRQEMVRRDHIDSTREINPLRRAHDARLVDTTGLKVPQVVRRMLSMIRESQTKSGVGR